MKTLLGCMSMFAIVFAFTAGSLTMNAVWVAEGRFSYRELSVGTGAVAETGKVALIHFTGWIDNNGIKGKKFFDSRPQGQPVAFKIGTDGVIAGWNIGVVGMQAGGRRMLMIPSELAYGDRGAAGLVPPNADLIYVIELIEVR
jgi:FKBP-type peptidyl-prolyl cis-trans isomerase